MSFIGSLIWFGLLGLVVRYFQTVVHIERQYEYIHKLEENISSNYDNKAFTREGKTYQKAYPLFSEWTWILYTFIFPLLLLIVIFTKVISEFHMGNKSPVLFINVVFFLCILISTLFYLLYQFRRK